MEEFITYQVSKSKMENNKPECLKECLVILEFHGGINIAERVVYVSFPDDNRVVPMPELLEANFIKAWKDWAKQIGRVVK